MKTEIDDLISILKRSARNFRLLQNTICHFLRLQMGKLAKANQCIIKAQRLQSEKCLALGAVQIFCSVLNRIFCIKAF
jgi:hypothetical protein